MTKEILLVDGYNIIFAWKDLQDLSKDNLEAARMKLADMLCNYQGFQNNEVILVFDGYKTKGGTGSIIHYYNIDIVYTKEAETADQFIESIAQKMARRCKIRVATSDALEQIMILGQGATRISARELRVELEEADINIRDIYTQKNSKKRNSFMDNISPEMAAMLEKMRLDKL